ncbi:MAG: NAD-dependent epimerase/dehydratase family protein, partial [Xanthobacteraceae bacterium]
MSGAPVIFDLRGKRVFVAGHAGMAGAAIMRRLEREDCEIIFVSRRDLDLRQADKVERFMTQAKPDAVFVAAGKVGGIRANAAFPADFLADNIAIALNTIHAAHRCAVKKLVYLGSSCIYPRLAPQPIREEYLLTGALEPTNRPYALAKIAGVEMCWDYNRQYGTHYL